MRNGVEKANNTVGRKVRTTLGEEKPGDIVRNGIDSSKEAAKEVAGKGKEIIKNATKNTSNDNSSSKGSAKDMGLTRDVNKGVVTNYENGKKVLYKKDGDTTYVKRDDEPWVNIDSPSEAGIRLDDFKKQMKERGDDWDKLPRKKRDEIVKELESGRAINYMGCDNYVTYDPSLEAGSDERNNSCSWGVTQTPAQKFWGEHGTALVIGVAATAAIAIAAHRHIKKKRNEKMLAGLKDRAENASDPKTRKEYKEFYNAMLGSLCKDNGKMRTSPKMSKIPKEYRDDFKDMYKSAYNDKDLRKEGRRYIKDNGSDFIQYDRSRGESTPKEQVAKAKDGSEIHARRKKSGHGMTYVRMKGGKEIGYATKSEFRAARKNEGMVSLKDALLESFEI